MLTGSQISPYPSLNPHLWVTLGQTVTMQCQVRGTEQQGRPDISLFLHVVCAEEERNSPPFRVWVHGPTKFSVEHTGLEF